MHLQAEPDEVSATKAAIERKAEIVKLMTAWNRQALLISALKLALAANAKRF
jgi:hypothetical protein